MTDEVEFEFFGDEDTAEVPARRPGVRVAGIPPELVRRRRLVAMIIAGSIALILVVALLTQNSTDPALPYRAYISRLAPIATDSAEAGGLLTGLFTQMRTGAATNPLATLNTLTLRAQRDLARAQAIRPPSELRTEHAQVLMALEFRASGLRGLHDALGASSGLVGAPAEAAIATQIDRLTTSDVVWARWVWRPIEDALVRLHAKGVTAPRSRFVTDINAPAQASIAALLSPASTTGGTVLALGATGTAVKSWQERLNGWLAVTHKKQLTADGNFGPGTKAATEALQNAQGLTPDGAVGPQTQRALTAALAAKHGRR